MVFENKRIHSLDQINRLKQDFQKPLTLEALAILYVEMAQHGLFECETAHERLKSQIKRKDLLKLLDRQLMLCHNVFRTAEYLKVCSNVELFHKLYDRESLYFKLGFKSPEKLLIVFNTIFNNFYISNAGLIAFLEKLGISVLLLKDPTRFAFLSGIKTLGNKSFRDFIVWLNGFLTPYNFKKILTTGFSSGGFASILTASEIKADGCLAFAPSTDLSNTSLLPQPRYMTEQLKSSLPENLRINLCEKISDNDLHCVYKVFYGDQSLSDKQHALNLEGSRNVKVKEIKGYGHGVPVHFFISGELELELENLFLGLG